MKEVVSMKRVGELHGCWRDDSIFTVCGLYISSAKPELVALQDLTCPYCKSVYEDWKFVQRRIRLVQLKRQQRKVVQGLNTVWFELGKVMERSQHAFQNFADVVTASSKV